MASRKKKASSIERPIMDAAGAKDSFMHKRADLDKQDSTTAALDKALSKVKDICITIAKSIAHAQSTETDEMKMACLDEIATLGNKARDKSRAALRDANKA